MSTPTSRTPSVIALLLGAAVLLATTWASADPPLRVMRLGYIDGPVSFSPAGEDDWVQASINRPLTGGDRLWVDAGARAELQVGQIALRADGGTSVSLLNLDDRVAQVELGQGTLDIRVRQFAAGDVLEIDTPNLAFSILRAGDYRIEVDPARGATTVMTRSGQAEVYGESAGYVVDAGRAYRFYGTALADYEFLAMPQPDDLDLWAAARDRRWDASVSARYVSPEVTGYQDLDAYGAWRAESGYGNVWVPSQVAVGWAPYRDGHWAWIEPWGWTWVDDAPWGFAVSHYGRWASIRGRWCWVPGPVVARAVYAPALVAFVGGSNFQVAIGAGGVGAVAWFPLGPREVYRPAYPVSRTYFTRVNTSNTVINVTNVTNVYNQRNVRNVNYVNRHVPGAVVAVPRTAFVEAQPVSRHEMRLGRDALVNAPVSSIAAVAPLPRSVRGSAAPGHRPPSQALDRRVVARTVPPPAPVPFAAKERLLAENPGRPLDRSAVGALRPATPAPASNVQLVTPPRTKGRTDAASAGRNAGGQRGQPAAAAPGAAAAQEVPPPLRRGQTPMTTGQPAPVAAPASGRAEPRGRSGQGAPAPAPAESRGGKPAPRTQPPTAVAPPASAPAPAASMQRHRAEPAPMPPAARAAPPPVYPMNAAPAPQPAPQVHRGAAPPPRAAPAPQPAPATAAPQMQRGHVESRSRPSPPPAAAATAPAPPPPAPTDRRGRAAQPPPPAKHDKQGDDQKAADDAPQQRHR